MKLGLDRLCSEFGTEIGGKNIAILGHRASLNSSGKQIIDILADFGCNLKALFGPEHGFDTRAQDMESVSASFSRLPRPNGLAMTADTEIPIYSLYGDSFGSLRPTPKMLDGIDTLIVDLQDIGSRYYTYIYTMAFCMETAKKTGTKVIVCDRPNPINGIDIEGSLIEYNYLSFVGAYPIANRHGMTVGELATYFNAEFNIGCNLEVARMSGWKREIYFDETGLAWTNPSPNMRSTEASLLYPGMCLIEGTNISEGRGTSTPFELCGAPFIDSSALLKNMNEFNLPGIVFQQTSFTPDMQKWNGRECFGLKLEVTDRKIFKPYETGLSLLCSLHKEQGFEWRTDEYEFRSDVPAIDLLTGSSCFRESLDAGQPFDEIKNTLTKTPECFLTTRKKYLLY